MDSEVNTNGILSAGSKTVLHFPQGLYGFEKHTDFILSESEYKPFMWLQSVKEKALAFLVVDPFLFFTDYEIDVDDQSVRDIGVKSPADVCIIVIITLAKEKKLSLTANLQGPLVINKNNRAAKQVVLADPRWLTKHDLNLNNAQNRSSSC